jgi:histidinol-phosphatase
MTNELDRRLQLALSESMSAQRLILQFYQQADLAVERKSDDSPVTLADRGAEQMLRERIINAFPNDSVFGEEFGETKGSNEYRWVLDPIDGTKAFVAGVPLFGTMLGLERAGECVMGVVRFPALGEVVYAAQGQGTWRQRRGGTPTRVRVTATAELSRALLCFTDVDGWCQIGQQEAFGRLCRSVRIARGWGDCYGHVLVATGGADLAVDPLMNPWDAAALVPIVREAGGEFVDWTGAATIYGGDGISTNGHLTPAVLALLADRAEVSGD